MITVLMKYKISLAETLHEVKHVEFYPPEGAHAPGLLLHYDDNHHGFFSPTPEDDGDWRDVFIMNSAGQTVARYTL